MKNLTYLLLLCTAAVTMPGTVCGQRIKVNQVGYLPGNTKYAWVNDLRGSSVNWTVRRAKDREVMYTSTSQVNHKIDPATGECVTKLDFGAMNDTGHFYIKIDKLDSSYTFIISPNAYAEVWKAAMKSYYFQRSGINLEPRYAGIWARKASHTHDAMLYLGFAKGKIIEGPYQDSRGGWYDAGDFGKKIVPASIAFYAILKLADYFPGKVSSMHVDLPNPYRGLPDMLAEAKWEMDWFFTMQEKDGAVHHLIVSPDFFIGPPQNDSYPRYILDTTSNATADFAATMAMAYRVYKPYLPTYADSCLAAAEKAWQCLRRHPGIFPAGGYHDPEGIHATGAYEDPHDGDERLWAAAELFNATGKKQYLQFVEMNCSAYPPKQYAWWQDPHNYAIYTYLLSTWPGKDPQMIKIMKEKVREYADRIRARIDIAAYAVSLLPGNYVWGSNSYVLNYGMELLVIDKILGSDTYREAALRQLDYILGCNSLDLSFVCNYGTHAVKDPHQSINTYDNLEQAPPGFIPGGPNQYPQDPTLAKLISTKNPPPAKCYVDFHWAYACNEVCLPYTSGFIFLAGYFLSGN